MTTIGLDSENKLFRPLSPIHKNYHKIITSNGPEFYCDRLKKGGDWLQSHSTVCIIFGKALSTVRLLNAVLYQCVDIEIVI